MPALPPPPVGEPAPPARRPTIRDVAAVAGVSKSVASRVYSGSTHVSEESRRRVLQAAEQIGFRPNWVARSLAGDRDDFVGILVADLHNPVFAEVVDAARAELALAGQVGLMTSAVLPAADEGARLDDHALALFGDLRPSRILLVGTIPDLDRVGQAWPSARIVAASAVPEGLADARDVRVVRGDDAAGVALLVDHLVGLGHRDIAFVGGRGGPVSAVRAAAYTRLLRERGGDALVRVQPSDYTEAGGRAAAEALLAAERVPSAIIAVNDLAAIGVLVATEAERERSGRRIAVTGYDNTFLAALPQLDLTSVEPGNGEIGRAAARAIIDAGPSADEVLIAPRLVVRGSTRRA